MIGKILVPTDFSPPTRHGLLHAVVLAEKFPAEIVILHVIEQRMIEESCHFGLDEEKKIKEKIWKKSREALDVFLSGVEFRQVPFQKVIVHGTPFQEIIKKAKEIKANLIVLGTFGMAVDLNRLFFGSTAEKVVRMLPCPVLCVPPPEL